MLAIDFSLPCAHCKTSLEGIPLNGACAKCGAPVAATIGVGILDTRARTIAVDLPCLHCEYNLRTLKPESRCPECGQPVSDSLGSNALLLASPQWRRTVYRGVRLVLYAGLGFPTSVFLLWLIDEFDFGTAFIISTAVAVFGSMSLMGIGVFCATARDATARERPGSMWPNVLARVSVLLTLPLLFLGLGASQLTSLQAKIATWGTLVLLLMNGSTIILCLASSLRRIAQRANDHALEKKTTSWIHISAVCLGFFILGILLCVSGFFAGAAVSAASFLVGIPIFFQALPGLENYQSLLMQTLRPQQSTRPPTSEDEPTGPSAETEEPP